MPTRDKSRPKPRLHWYYYNMKGLSNKYCFPHLPPIYWLSFVFWLFLYHSFDLGLIVGLVLMLTAGVKISFRGSMQTRISNTVTLITLRNERLIANLRQTRFPDLSDLRCPLNDLTAALKKASLKKSMEPENTTRALLRACKPAIWKMSK